MAVPDPAELDPGKAWLLDRIAERRCHLYLCDRKGTRKVRLLIQRQRPDGTTVSAEIDAFECEQGHAGRRPGRVA